MHALNPISTLWNTNYFELAERSEIYIETSEASPTYIWNLHFSDLVEFCLENLGIDFQQIYCYDLIPESSGFKPTSWVVFLFDYL